MLPVQQAVTLRRGGSLVTCSAEPSHAASRPLTLPGPSVVAHRHISLQTLNTVAGLTTAACVTVNAASLLRSPSFNHRLSHREHNRVCDTAAAAFSKHAAFRDVVSVWM